MNRAMARKVQRGFGLGGSCVSALCFVIADSFLFSEKMSGIRFVLKIKPKLCGNVLMSQETTVTLNFR